MTLAAAVPQFFGSFDYPRSIRQAWPRERGAELLTEQHHVTEQPPSSMTVVFSAGEEPEWVGPTVDKLNELRALPKNWDRHGADPLRPEVVMFAFQLLQETLDPMMSPPQIVPLSHGGLQLEWHQKDIELEIEIVAPGLGYVSFEDRRTDSEFETQLGSDFRLLSGPIELLATR